MYNVQFYIGLENGRDGIIKSGWNELDDIATPHYRCCYVDKVCAISRRCTKEMNIQQDAIRYTSLIFKKYYFVSNSILFCIC
uniref:Uncharacterized protein n=1 Tax=Heterorhabditis bacteriophora TaxID=37862 RepID=A0A1I7WR79_HETBA